ncbi:ester cyclase [Curvivirga aplysinae]|uniref:ester cyclase n=1 Tax=Curvivirga aplysinae TaxID=2529852 RepID=UPI0012BB86E5|nr:ester cyclase [Curvivirga aplysinae]MTI11168.1 polyketide cyclase [Curvivirga aplysinae]
MKKLLSLVLGGFIWMTASTAMANDIDLVKSFYSELLSDTTASDMADRTKKILSDDWTTNEKPTGHAGFAKTVAYFGSIIPDLEWEVVDILQDGNRYVVRGKATGTPVKPLFGAPATGNAFEIMSIDIHTVENGKIVNSYHIEDWLKALKQIKG